MIITADRPHHASRRRSSWTLFILIATAVLIAALAAMVQPLPQISAPLSEHALISHGDDAVTARQCLDGKDGWIFYNPKSGRFAFVCWLEDKWGIVILSITFSIITAFFTKQLKTIDQVRRYLKRQGYEEL